MRANIYLLLTGDRPRHSPRPRKETFKNNNNSKRNEDEHISKSRRQNRFFVLFVLFVISFLFCCAIDPSPTLLLLAMILLCFFSGGGRSLPSLFLNRFTHACVDIYVQATAYVIHIHYEFLVAQSFFHTHSFSLSLSVSLSLCTQCISFFWSAFPLLFSVMFLIL